MARIEKIREVLCILGNYYPLGECDAQHDVLYVEGPSPDKLSEGHRLRLRELNVTYDEGLSSWQVFT